MTASKNLKSAMHEARFTISSNHYLLIALLLVGLMFRTFFVLGVHLKPVSDPAIYDELAVSILSGKGLSNASGKATAFRPPVYPIFLATIYKLFGHNYKIVMLLLNNPFD